MLDLLVHKIDLLIPSALPFGSLVFYETQEKHLSFIKEQVLLSPYDPIEKV